MKKVSLRERLIKMIFPHWFDDNGDRVDFNKNSPKSEYNNDISTETLRSYLAENDLIDATTQLIDMFKVDNNTVRAYIINAIQKDKEQNFFRITDGIQKSIKSTSLRGKEGVANSTESALLPYFEVHFNLFDVCENLNIKPNHQLYYLIAAMFNEYTHYFVEGLPSYENLVFKPRYEFAKTNGVFHIYFTSTHGLYARDMLIDFQEQFYSYFAYGKGSTQLNTKHVDTVIFPIANNSNTSLARLQNQLLLLSSVSYQLKVEFDHFYNKMSLTYFDSINNIGYILSEEYKDIKQYSEENLELSIAIVEKIYRAIKEQLEHLQTEKIKYQKDMKEASINSRRKILEMELEVLEKSTTDNINQSEVIANIIKEDLKTS